MNRKNLRIPLSFAVAGLVAALLLTGLARTALTAPAPQPKPPTLEDILKRLADDRVKVRDQASKDLDAALEAGRLTAAQIEDLKKIAESNDPAREREVQARVRRALQAWLYKQKKELEKKLEELEKALNGDGQVYFLPATGTASSTVALRLTAGDFDDRSIGEAEPADAEAVWAGWLALDDATRALAYDEALARLASLDAFLAALSDDRFAALGLTKDRAGVRADVAALSQQIEIERSVDGGSTGAGVFRAAVNGPGPAETGKTFRITAGGVIVPGSFAFSIADPATLGIAPPDGYLFAGDTYTLIPDSLLQTGGTAAVAIQFDTAPDDGPAIDPSAVRIAQFSEGVVQILDTSVTGDGTTFTAAFPAGDGGPDPAATFALVIPTIPSSAFAAAAPPQPAVNLNDILTRLGDDDFDVRQQASKDLETAFRNNTLTAAQKTALVGVAYGRAQGSDLEVKWRVRKLVTVYLPKEYAAVAAIWEPLKITILTATRTEVTYTFGDIRGRFRTDARNTDFQRFQRYVDRLRLQVEAGEFAKARQTLDEIDAFFGRMSGTRINDMGLGNGGLDSGDVRVRTGRVRDRIDAATGNVGGMEDGGEISNSSVDSLVSAAGELPIGRTLQVSVSSLPASGTMQFFVYPGGSNGLADLGSALLPPDGFHYVGDRYVLFADDSLVASGEAQIRLEYSPDLSSYSMATPPDDPAGLQIARVANGIVEVLATTFDAVHTYSARYLPGADGPESFGIFVLVAPGSAPPVPYPYGDDPAPPPPIPPPGPTSSLNTLAH